MISTVSGTLEIAASANASASDGPAYAQALINQAIAHPSGRWNRRDGRVRQ